MQIEDLLYQKNLYLPLKKKLDTMKDEEWEVLDRQVLGMVRLTLARNVAYNVMNQKTTAGLLEALANMYEKPSAMNKELIEKLSKCELPKNEYPCMNDPSPTIHGTDHPGAVQYTETPIAHSKRSRRTPTWARPRSSDDGYSSDSILRHASSDFKRMGRRIFVFIVGGATRSEMRVCHKLSTKLNREVILGSSSIDDPPEFIKKLKLLSSADELSLDDLEI